MKPGATTRPARIDDPGPGDRLGGDPDNLSAAHADVADGIQPRFRVHYPAALQHKIELLRRDKSGRED